MIARFSSAIGCALLMTGCAGVQHALDPEGPQAERIASLWWLMLIVCTIVLVAVCALVILAVMKGRRGETEVSLSHRDKWRLVLAGGVVVPVFVLIGLITYSVFVDRAVVAEPADALHIQVVGHQWWWSVTYPSRPQTNLSVTTANEIHIPAGRPVHVELHSRDVIHSFWVPNLHGKTDLIPGQTTTTWLQADRPGVWRGQCAEYCGLQHAHMAMVVVAHDPPEFEQWLAAQLEPAREPTTELASRGREVFLGAPCVMCHRVRGTLALATFGPDLTHLASRRTLAAGTVPNTVGNLGGWILNPHGIKPGVRMPPVNLPPEDFHALLAYLAQLK